MLHTYCCTVSFVAVLGKDGWTRCKIVVAMAHSTETDGRTYPSYGTYVHGVP